MICLSISWGIGIIRCGRIIRIKGWAFNWKDHNLRMINLSILRNSRTIMYNRKPWASIQGQTIHSLMKPNIITIVQWILPTPRQYQQVKENREKQQHPRTLATLLRCYWDQGIKFLNKGSIWLLKTSIMVLTSVLNTLKTILWLFAKKITSIVWPNTNNHLVKPKLAIPISQLL